MPPKEPPTPTNAELEVLQILWRHGPSTVREVHEALHPRRKGGYTAALKLLQVMHRKGLVQRDDTRRAHTYGAVLTEESTLSRLTWSLLDKAFGGAVDKLVLHAFSRKKASPEEFERIRRMLDALEEEAK